MARNQTKTTKVREQVRPTEQGVRSGGRIPTAKDRGDAIRAAYAGQFTQVQVAAQLGVAQNTVSRWSTGDVEPSLEDIARLEEVCGLPRGTVLRNAGYVVDYRTADEMIMADQRLDQHQRQLVLSAYKAALRQSQS